MVDGGVVGGERWVPRGGWWGGAVVWWCGGGVVVVVVGVGRWVVTACSCGLDHDVGSLSLDHDVGSLAPLPSPGRADAIEAQ